MAAESAVAAGRVAAAAAPAAAEWVAAAGALPSGLRVAVAAGRVAAAEWVAAAGALPSGLPVVPAAGADIVAAVAGDVAAAAAAAGRDRAAADVETRRVHRMAAAADGIRVAQVDTDGNEPVFDELNVTKFPNFTLRKSHYFHLIFLLTCLRRRLGFQDQAVVGHVAVGKNALTRRENCFIAWVRTRQQVNPDSTLCSLSPFFSHPP